MYAVIKAGGKQHRVKPGDVIEVELMHGGHEESVAFTPILVVDDDGKAHVGKDLGKASVTGKLVGEHKGEKVKVLKYRQKTGYKRSQGHRQLYTLVEIQEVKLGGRAPSKKAKPATAEDAGAPAAADVEPAPETTPEETAEETPAVEGAEA